MSAEFDLSDFDAPTDTPDHTALFDAMRDAGASGVRDAIAPLARSIQPIALGLADLKHQIGEMRQAERALQSARSALFWDNAKHLLLYAAVAGLVLGGAGVGYHFVKRPKIETQYFGCADWNARTKDCKGQWMPLTPKKPDGASE